ncbi:hypothetical protein VPH35_071200 [Triticum aestivum]
MHVIPVCWWRDPALLSYFSSPPTSAVPASRPCSVSSSEARVRQLTPPPPPPPRLSTLDVPNLHHQVESLIPGGDDFIFASSASGRGTESGGKGSRRRDDENPGVDTREIGCSREASCSTVAHEPTRSCRPR